MSDLDLFHELSFYTLAHQGPEFIHQHIVDAFAVQTANVNTKRIAIVFGLIGLYLHLVKGYTGKQVQHAHMQLAKGSKQFDALEPPIHRGSISVKDVWSADPGTERDAMIHAWCRSVWDAFALHHDKISKLAATL